MQTIVHSYIHSFKTLKNIEYVYSKLSDFSVIKHTENGIQLADKIEIPDCCTELIYTFYNNNLYVPVHFYEEEYTPVETVKGDKFMLVCASGGKDSTAVAKMLKDKGYNVLLYHMKGINQAYYDEFEAVKRIADRLNVPYYIEEVKLKGKHQYIEHPMKNMLIANGAIQFCLDHKLPINIVFGNYGTSQLETMDFGIDAGDSRDMWDIYERIIRNEIPKFRLYTPLDSVKDTFDILQEDILLLADCISCMSPYRFRKHWKERTEKKYGVNLIPNRCGCCWKCCLEYMVLVDNGFIKHDYFFNQDYYNHCFDILRKTTQKETGYLNLTADEVWQRYFWYDISKSHLTFTF